MSVEFIRNQDDLRHLVITRFHEGQSIRQLSRFFRISRNRVRRILRKAKHLRDEGEALPVTHRRLTRGSKLDAFNTKIKELLNTYPTITAVRMREELAVLGYKGGMTILRERLRRIRPRPVREPVIRFETDPGVQGQMDWSPYTIRFAREGKQTVLCFSYILGFSRRQYVDFVMHRDFFTLIRRHRDAWEYFGGVPMQCLYDSEKTVVLRWEAGRPLYNPTFIEFITHYRCKPVACRRGRAQTKGKIERPFQYVEGNLLNARTPVDLNDLRTIRTWWMANVSDPHVHETTGFSPLELFLQQERAALQPLPAHAHECAEIVFRVGRSDGFIEFQTNLYSIPYEYDGEILTVKATEHEIFVYTPYVDLIAHHERCANGAGKKSESALHHRNCSLRYGLEPVQEVFLRLGDTAAPFLEGLKKKHPRNPGMHARLILQCKQRYHPEDINRALRHAMRYYAFDAGAIERILKATAKPRTLESLRNEKAREQLEQTLPEIRQRPLEDYRDMIQPGDGGDNEEQQRAGCDGTDKIPLSDPESAPDGENTG